MLKTIEIDGIDVPVVLSRRKGTRSLRIAIKSDGSVRLSVPYGVPELFAKRFLIQKQAWIRDHLKIQPVILDGAHIGKNHQLTVKRTTAARSHTKVTGTEIFVTLPLDVEVHHTDAQKTIRKACEKALLLEAEALLPQRLETLSKQFNVPYTSCSVKKLKSRWGACDSLNNISFNTYLVQLDWILIDYVICHELAHTVHHHHQESFWQLVGAMYPKYKTARKLLKTKPTDIFPTIF